MVFLLLNYVVLGALWKIDVHLISTLVNKSLYYYIIYYSDRQRNTSIQRYIDCLHEIEIQLFKQTVWVQRIGYTLLTLSGLI